MDKSKHQQVPVSSAIPHSFRCLQSGQREGSRSASVMTSFLRTVGEPSARPSPPRANAALLRGVDREPRTEGRNPYQLRPTRLPRGFQVETGSVVSPSPDVGRSSGSRALRLLPGSYSPLLPSQKRPVRRVESFSLTAAGQPRILTGFPFLSLRRDSENQHGPQFIGAFDICQQRFPTNALEFAS